MVSFKMYINSCIHNFVSVHFIQGAYVGKYAHFEWTISPNAEAAIRNCEEEEHEVERDWVFVNTVFFICYFPKTCTRQALHKFVNHLKYFGP